MNVYHDFSLPIDLRAVRIMADLDISYALGSTLLTHGRDGQFSSNLASKWKVDNLEQTVTFDLDPAAKWSDGTTITPVDAIASFANTKANFSESIPSLFESYETLSELSDNKIRFKLAAGSSMHMFLEKLTEPMHGLVKIIKGKASIDVTSGPYKVESFTESEIVLKANLHWSKYSPKMIERLHLRRPTRAVTASTLQEDPWPDLLNSPIILMKQDLKQLPADAKFWRRSNDRLLAFSHAGKNLDATRILFGFLKGHSPLEKLSQLIDGGQFATQIYAKGLILHSDQEPKIRIPSKAEVEKRFPDGKIKIAYDPNRLPAPLVHVLKTEICGVLPIKCEFAQVDVKQLSKIRRSGEFDVFIGSVGVDSINLDGALSYYFELNPSMIPSDSSTKGNFIARLKAARKNLADHAPVYRQILFDAVEGSYVLPVAHFSTTWIGRAKIDFSEAPSVFETIPFQYLRINE